MKFQKKVIKIKDFYNKNYDKFQNSIKSIGWSSKKDQYLRFSKLLQNIDINNKSILDVGCGFGDLIFFIKKYNKKKKFIYTGVDISDKILSYSKTVHKKKNIKFICGDFYSLKLIKHDIVLSSGSMSLNLHLKSRNLENMIEKMMIASNYCVVMNFLSSYSDYQLKKNQHFSPEKLFKISKKFSKKVNIIHDYNLYEFTVQIFK